MPEINFATNCKVICQTKSGLCRKKKSKMTFCYTLKVHSFPFTMSLKLSPFAQYQQCYDRSHLRHYRELHFQKYCEVQSKVEQCLYCLKLVPCVTYHCCKWQSFSFHTLASLACLFWWFASSATRLIPSVGILLGFRFRFNRIVARRLKITKFTGNRKKH